MRRAFRRTGGVSMGVVLAFVLGSAACKSKSDQGKKASGQVQAVERVWSSNHEAIPIWIGADARFAAFWVFDRDTNGDGEVKAIIGDHGESLGDEPRLVLVDGQTQRVISAESVIAVDPSGHFMVLEEDGKAILFNGRTGTKEELPDVDLETDHNTCERHRSVSFDPTGGRIGWVRTDGTYATRAVRGGKTQEFKSKQRIWRGEPLTHSDWAVLETVEGNFPRMKTSCHASWSRGLARSQGRYGWDRDYQTSLVRSDGLQINPTRRLLPLSRSVLLDVDKLHLESVDGSPIGPVLHAFLGSEMVVVQGSEGPQLLSTETQEINILANIQFQAPIQILHHGREWVHGRRSSGEAVRVHLKSGQVDVGPSIIGSLVAPHSSGWWGFKSGPEMLNLWDLESGLIISRTIEGLHQVGGLAFSRREEGKELWFTMDPSTGNYSELKFRPQWIGETGCSMPNPVSGLVRGLSAWCPHGQPEKSRAAQ